MRAVGRRSVTDWKGTDVGLAATVAGEGPPLLLLHGFTGSGAIWAEHAHRLRGFRTIAPDLPGHGRSPDPGSADDLESIADCVVEILDREGIESASWLGYSMGGRVALAAAMRHPRRFDRLVLEGASAGIADPGEREARRVADDALADSILNDGVEAFVDRWERIPLFATQRRLPARTLARQREHRLAATARGLASGLRAASVGRQPSYWERLADLRMPTTIIVGAEDTKYVDQGRRLREGIEGAVLHVVEGAGHAVHLEKPKVFWELVLDALGVSVAGEHADLALGEEAR